mmetsp:Transcript_19282/g.33153  ORF Transcript_19282/g.33153 Transcript_19282/m.33153 type:complete len:256 (+) Transcript_19282:144-911(+)
MRHVFPNSGYTDVGKTGLHVTAQGKNKKKTGRLYEERLPIFVKSTVWRGYARGDNVDSGQARIGEDEYELLGGVVFLDALKDEVELLQVLVLGLHREELLSRDEEAGNGPNIVWRLHAKCQTLICENSSLCTCIRLVGHGRDSLKTFPITLPSHACHNSAMALQILLEVGLPLSLISDLQSNGSFSGAVVDSARPALCNSGNIYNAISWACIGTENTCFMRCFPGIGLEALRNAFENRSDDTLQLKCCAASSRSA